MTSSDILNQLETFGLSKDRQAFIKDLIPYSRDYYYFSILHLLNQNNDGSNEQQIQKLIESCDESTRASLTQLITRFKLSGSAESFYKWFENEKRHYYPHLSHTADATPGETQKATYPSTLDESIFNNWKTNPDISGLTEAVRIYFLELYQKLPDYGRRALLQSLDGSEGPLVLELVKEFLQNDINTFGHFPVHLQLSLDQLDALLKWKPPLIDNSTFVQEYLNRLQPDSDADIQNSPEDRKAYVQKLLKFVNGLSINYNGMKATLLYETLEYNRKKGVFDDKVFYQYLELTSSARSKTSGANIGGFYGFAAVKSIPAPSDDVALITYHLKRYFLTSFTDVKDALKFTQYGISETALKVLLAEVRLTNPALDPKEVDTFRTLYGSDEAVKSLSSRVELSFTTAANVNQEVFRPEEDVVLSVDVKNIKVLIVKIFEVNTSAYYKSNANNNGEINADSLQLDGLTANKEQILRLENELKDWNSIKRYTKSIALPELKGRRGVWIVQCIGADKTIRCCIKKGQLNLISRPTLNGHILKIIDETGEILKDDQTELFLQGHTYTPDRTSGDILVPYLAHSGRQQVVALRNKDFYSTGRFNHMSQEYAFDASFYTDRESLLRLRSAKVIVRAALRLNGLTAPLSSLKDVKLTIESTDKEYAKTRSVVKDFQLHEDKDSVYEFLVMDSVRSFTFTLSAIVPQSASLVDKQGADAIEQPVSSSGKFDINDIDADADITEDLHLSLAKDGYRIYVLGKSGEPRVGVVLNLNFTSIYTNNPISATLQTDEKGSVFLGKLQDITTIDHPGVAGKLAVKSWTIQHGLVSVATSIGAPSTINVLSTGAADGVLARIPWTGGTMSLGMKAMKE